MNCTPAIRGPPAAAVAALPLLPEVLEGAVPTPIREGGAAGTDAECNRCCAADDETGSSNDKRSVAVGCCTDVVDWSDADAVDGGVRMDRVEAPVVATCGRATTLVMGAW